ncbi:unnamed protein product [Leuciscus chuanchicus]
MAGSGIALRLHEFQESPDTIHQQAQVFLCSLCFSSARRQGRDVLGVYPGQIARVHTVSSHLHRSAPKTPDLLHNESRAEQCYKRRAFDQLSLQASLLSGHSSSQLSIGTDVQKFTLSSHPGPLETHRGDDQHLYLTQNT